METLQLRKRVVIDTQESSDSDSVVIQNESESDLAMSASGDEFSSDASDSEAENANAGWADSMAKILKMGKPKGKKTLVLAKAKKLADVRTKDEQGVEIVPGVDEKPNIDGIKSEDADESARKTAKTRVRKKNDIPNVRVKPKILEKDRERTLSKIATRGVVQLFNAVRNQQKTIEKTMDDAGPLDRKKDKAMKKFDKRSFLDSLMGSTKSTVVDDVTKRPKLETKSEDTKPKWNVLRDDFMMGAKMKDWDKETEEPTN